MTLRDPRRRWAVSTAIILSGLVAAMPLTALAQSGARPAPSPVAPSDTRKPSFDTITPTYGGTTQGQRAAETIVAEVDGHAITLGEVSDRINQMPANIANLPFELIFPNVVEYLVRRQALVLRARRLGYDENPAIRRRVKIAADELLATEFVQREAEQTVTDQQVQERYGRDYAGKPGPDEVHVRVISVLTEPEATAVIDRLNKGEDFAVLAKEVSKDPSSLSGGDLGFLAREALNAEIGAVAFVLPPGQTSSYPVRSAGSWFVVRTEARRKQPTRSYAVMKETIRQSLVREATLPVVRAALADVTVREYDVSGKEVQAGPSVSQ